MGTSRSSCLERVRVRLRRWLCRLLGDNLRPDPRPGFLPKYLQPCHLSAFPPVCANAMPGGCAACQREAQTALGPRHGHTESWQEKDHGHGCRTAVGSQAEQPAFLPGLPLPSPASEVSVVCQCCICCQISQPLPHSVFLDIQMLGTIPCK